MRLGLDDAMSKEGASKLKTWSEVASEVAAEPLGRELARVGRGERRGRWHATCVEQGGWTYARRDGRTDRPKRLINGRRRATARACVALTTGPGAPAGSVPAVKLTMALTRTSVTSLHMPLRGGMGWVVAWGGWVGGCVAREDSISGMSVLAFSEGGTASEPHRRGPSRRAGGRRAAGGQPVCGRPFLVRPLNPTHMFL
jgi:hypothetical protein